MRESACCAMFNAYSRPSSSDDSRLTKTQHAMAAENMVTANTFA